MAGLSNQQVVLRMIVAGAEALGSFGGAGFCFPAALLICGHPLPKSKTAKGSWQARAVQKDIRRLTPHHDLRCLRHHASSMGFMHDLFLPRASG